MTEAPLPTAIWLTTPARPAKISFSIFMASSIITTVRDCTRSPTLTRTSVIVPGIGAAIALPLPPGATGAALGAAGAGGAFGAGVGAPSARGV